MKLCVCLAAATLLMVSVDGVPTNDISSLNVTKTFHLQTLLKANWFRSYHYCVANGMRLASISSKAENDQILKQITESGFIDDYWLGGTNLGNEPSFYWMGHNKPMMFTDWLQNQPDNWRGNENCLELWITNGMKWNDRQCGDLRYFICESEIERAS